MSHKKKVDKLTLESEEQAWREEQGIPETETGKGPQEEDLQQKISALETENAELKDKYLRSMAEFENFRRRSNQEKADWIKLATQRLSLELCDVVDNFERALQQSVGRDPEDPFVKGVLMIEQQLRAVLAKEGVCKIEALGEEFDPAQHDALTHIPSEYEPNRVAAVIQNGYTMHGKVLRPARVAVSSGAAVPKTETKRESATQAASAEEASGGNGSEKIEIEIE